MIDLLERALALPGMTSPADKLDKLEALLAQRPGTSTGAAPLLAALLSIPTADRYPPLDFSPEQQKRRTFEALVDQLDGPGRAPAGVGAV